MDIFSFSPFGYEGALVNVEVDIRRGIPSVDLVGLADNAVKESRERMKSAIRNSGFSFPLGKVIVNLAHAADIGPCDRVRVLFSVIVCILNYTLRGVSDVSNQINIFRFGVGFHCDRTSHIIIHVAALQCDILPMQKN